MLTVEPDTEIRELRRTLREVIALSTLPAVWNGYDVRGIVEGLADVLVNTLSLDLVFVRLHYHGGLDVARGKGRPELGGHSSLIADGLAPILNDVSSSDIATVPDPLGVGTLRFVRLDLGQGATDGVLIAASRRPDFPTQSDRLLLHIGANQAAIMIQRKRAEDQVQESERRLSEMIDGLPAAVYTTDADGRLTHFNQACIAFSGRVPELGNDKWCVSWKLFRADGQPMPHDECPMAVTLREGRAIRGAEAIAERPDGSRIWFTPYPTVVRDAVGRIVGGINMLVDITHQKEA